MGLFTDIPLELESLYRDTTVYSNWFLSLTFPPSTEDVPRSSKHPTLPSFLSLADCNSVHDADSALTCREEDRPETIMAEFCRADFGEGFSLG